MNILSVNSSNICSNLNCSKTRNVMNFITGAQNCCDGFISRRKSVMNQIAHYLNSVGINTNINKNNSLEIEKLDKLPKDATEITDYILQYTDTIKGSVDFGKIGATNMGQVKELKGDLKLGRKFDFSTSEIKNFGLLEKIDGYMVISPKQLVSLDFEGLEVTGDIIVADRTGSTASYKRLDHFDKMALLGGFELLHY